MPENPWNPWNVLHKLDEMSHTDGEYTPALAEAVVDAEYRDEPEALSCPCGGTLYYKATIGCLKCTTCGQLAWNDGELID